MEQFTLSLRITGLLAIFGALLYAIGDVLLGKRILPQFVRDWTEGAGFNIAYLVFFICTTSTLWNGI